MVSGGGGSSPTVVVPRIVVFAVVGAFAVVVVGEVIVVASVVVITSVAILINTRHFGTLCITRTAPRRHVVPGPHHRGRRLLWPRYIRGAAWPADADCRRCGREGRACRRR